MPSQRCERCLQRVCCCEDPDDEDPVEQDEPFTNKERSKSLTPPTANPDRGTPEPFRGGFGWKRPVSQIDLWCDEELESPDLDEYFNKFALDEHERIRLCRTYANYLAQKVGAGRKKRVKGL